MFKHESENKNNQNYNHDSDSDNSNDTNHNSSQTEPIGTTATSETELQQLRISLARVSADFENYKKRQLREQALWRQNSQAEIFLELLVTIDSFDQAFMQYETGKNPELDRWMTGFQMIHKNFHELLKKFKITIIDEKIPFNPEYHEAIAQVPAENKAPGEIVQVHQKGFMLGERVLRPATVTVAK